MPSPVLDCQSPPTMITEIQSSLDNDVDLRNRTRWARNRRQSNSRSETSNQWIYYMDFFHPLLQPMMKTSSIVYHLHTLTVETEECSHWLELSDALLSILRREAWLKAFVCDVNASSCHASSTATTCTPWDIAINSLLSQIQTHFLSSDSVKQHEGKTNMCLQTHIEE